MPFLISVSTVMVIPSGNFFLFTEHINWTLTISRQEAYGRYMEEEFEKHHGDGFPGFIIEKTTLLP